MNSEIVEILGWLPVGFVSKVCSYIERNDAGHQHDHVFDVVMEAARLSGGNRNATLAAFLHDIGCGFDRDRHHEIGAELSEGLLRYNEIECDLDMVVKAVLEHRASWKGGYSSKVSEWVSAADRGKPDADRYLKRSYLYAKSKLGKNHEQSIQHALETIRGRFLLKTPEAPEWYFELYAEEWKQMREDLANETLERTAERMRFM